MAELDLPTRKPMKKYDRRSITSAENGRHTFSLSNFETEYASFRVWEKSKAQTCAEDQTLPLRFLTSPQSDTDRIRGIGRRRRNSLAFRPVQANHRRLYDSAQTSSHVNCSSGHNDHIRRMQPCQSKRFPRVTIP